MEVRIDIGENGLLINGNAVKLPCNVNALTTILGDARRTTFGKIPSGVFSEEEAAYLNAQAPDRACYTWDGLGMHCHTDDGETVNTLALYICKSEITKAPDYYPQSFFGGVFTVKGAAWLKQLEKGDKDEGSIELIIGEYSVYGSRADLRSHLFDKKSKYSMVELSLCEDDEDDELDFGDLFTK